MDYWITIKGVKHGPVQEWDIKKKITDKTLSTQDLVWHTGLDTWQKLEQHPNFKASFNEQPDPPTITIDRSSEVSDSKDTLRIQHFWGRRFLAKMYDLFLYLVIFFILTNICDIRFGLDPQYAWMNLFCLIPFMLLEAFTIQNYQTTPGKALFRLKVTPLNNESPVTLSRAFARSFGSWVIGMCLGFFPFFVISGTATFFFTKWKGNTRWDKITSMRVTGPERLSFVHALSWFSAIFLILILFSSFLNVDTDTLEAIELFNQETYKDIIKVQPQLEPFLKPPSES